MGNVVNIESSGNKHEIQIFLIHSGTVEMLILCVTPTISLLIVKVGL